MADEAGIDWRALLVRYMAHVWDKEGTPFVSHLSAGRRFTEAEVAALEQIEREAEEVPPEHGEASSAPDIKDTTA